MACECAQHNVAFPKSVCLTYARLVHTGLTRLVNLLPPPRWRPTHAQIPWLADLGHGRHPTPLELRLRRAPRFATGACSAT